ncbi:MAG: GspH/FimT family pseudopilin [Agarilytica sp.]
MKNTLPFIPVRSRSSNLCHLKGFRFGKIPIMKNITMLRGFTLVELLVTLSIAAILLAIVTPSFRDHVVKNNVASQLRNLKLDLALARSEAIARNAHVGICSSNDATDCLATADWTEGWILFEDNGEDSGTARDGVRNGAEPLVKVYQKGDDSVSITAFDVNDNDVSSLAFNSRGYLGLVENGMDLIPERLSFRFCVGEGVEFARGAIIALTGRIADSSDSDGDGVYENAASVNFDCPSI